MAFRWAIASTVALSILVGTGAPAVADLEEDRIEAVEELNRSREVFQEIVSNPETQIPPALLRDSQAIVIITNMGQGGFIFGGRSGDGLMVMREDNGWSNPVFVTLSGNSIGLQVGGSTSDFVLLVRSPEAIRDVLMGEVELGGSITGMAGPVGATVTDAAAMASDILIYSRSEGFFRGGTTDGTTLEFDEERNEVFYGVRNITAYQILTNPNLRAIATSDALERALLAAE